MFLKMQIHNLIKEVHKLVTFQHFLSLQFFRGQLSASGEAPTERQLEETTGSVFDESLELFERMKHDLLITLCEAILLDVKARSRPYRKDKYERILVY